MSQDQKPRPAKAVSIVQGSAASATEHEAAGAIAEDAIAVQENSGAAPKARRSLMPVILFLLGSAMGGAGLTALPHLMPELAERLYGKHP